MSDSSTEALDNKAKQNLDVVFSLVPDSAIKKPDINDIYFDARRAEISNVPRDLQLPWLFKNYNELARISFDATRTQDPQLIRGIWYYGVDSEHSFTRYHHVVRYNLIAMAYVWALDFPPELCGHDSTVRDFVLAFIEALFAYSQDEGDLNKKSFEAQERFLAMWQVSDLDLFTLRDIKTRRGVQSKVKKLVKKLYSQPLPESFHEIADMEARKIVLLRREGKISDEGYAKYGPSLILQNILRVEKLSQNLPPTPSKLKHIEERQMAQRWARRNGTDDPLAAVDWSSDIVSSLLNAVDQTLPHPKAIRQQPRPDNTRSPWMDKETLFMILNSGFEKLEEEDILTLSMGRLSLPSEREKLEKEQDDNMMDIDDVS